MLPGSTSTQKESRFFPLLVFFFLASARKPIHPPVRPDYVAFMGRYFRPTLNTFYKPAKERFVIQALLAFVYRPMWSGIKLNHVQKVWSIITNCFNLCIIPTCIIIEFYIPSYIYGYSIFCSII